MRKLVDDIAEDEDDPDADDEDYDDEAEEDDTGDFVDKGDADDADGRSRKPGKARLPRGGLIAEDDTLHLTLDQQREQEEADRLVKDIESRYGGPDGDEEIDLDDMGDYDEYEDEEGGGAAGAAGGSAAILPSIRDPKLWLIRCDPGTEEQMCLTLLQRFLSKAESRDDALFISSAFTTPASRGYVYVEADKEVHVKRAIRGLRALKWWRLQLIPINQMVNAVKFTDAVPVISRGQWVRVKGGLYKGDLAQVVLLSDQNTIITVRLIPRLDIAKLEEQPEPGRKRPRAFQRYSAAERPPQSLFNAKELKQRGIDVESKDDHSSDHRRYFVLRGNRYRRGYLYKDMRYDGLIVDNVQPTADEADRFLASVKDADDDGYDEDDDADIPPVQPAAAASKKASAAHFSIGDHVIVSSGAMRNITGRITSLSQSHCSIQPDAGQPIAMAVDLMLKEIRKFFRLGDHVKVVGGQYKDETGMVTQLQRETDSLCIYSDTSLREIVALAADVIESSEVSSGRDSLGSFSLHDLVQLSDNLVAVITKVEVASFKVLTQRGVNMTVRLQEIGQRRSSKFAAALDSQHNQLGRDDVVTVISGESKGRQGTVKHIYRHFLFLFSRQQQESSGMFVVPAKQVLLVGQTARKQQQLVPQSPQIGLGYEAGPGAGAAAADVKAGTMGPPAPRRRLGERHPLMGKSVVITGGPYKSFMGIVLEASELSCKVELHAMARKVIVNIGDVREKSSMPAMGGAQAAGAGAGRDYFIGGQTPLLGSRTPAYDIAGQTPAHDAFAGSQTPAYGGSTPSRDAWSAQTPARVWDEEGGGGVDEDVAEEWQQDYHQTPVPHTPSGVKTPLGRVDDDDEKEDDSRAAAAAAGRRAPRTPITPGTPVPRLPLTPAPQDEYATPNTPMQRQEQKGEDDDEGGSAASSSSHPLLPVGAKVVNTQDRSVGTIVSHTADGGVRVHLDEGVKGSSVVIGRQSLPSLQAVQPEKGDSVIVVSGEANVGQVGSLIGINHASGEAIVNVDGDIQILPVATLCKCDTTLLKT